MYDGLKNLEVPGRKRHPGARRAGRIVLVVVLGFAMLFVGYGIKVFVRVNSDIRKTHIALGDLAKEAPDGPVNILVLGSDRRDVVAPDERNLPQFNKSSSGQRADTIFMIHLSKGKKRGVLLQFPRDLRVHIPGHGFNKINAAYSFGQAQLMIKTVEELTGLSINHYVEVNFNSFRAIVDAVGGVDVHVNRALHDRKSGLNIPGAGCWTLSGQSALSFVRARYIDPTADIGRIQRQQQFMRALLHKVKSVGFLLNLPKVEKLSHQLSKGLRTDRRVNLGLARSIAAELADFGDKKLDFRVIPNTPRFFNHTSYVLPRPSEMQRLLQALKNDTALPNFGKTGESIPVPADVLVNVYNGTGKGGLAATYANKLRLKHFRINAVATARKSFAVTTIYFQPGAELKAELVRRKLGFSKDAVAILPADTPQVAQVSVYLGKDRLASPSSSASPRPRVALPDTKCRRL